MTSELNNLSPVIPVNQEIDVIHRPPLVNRVWNCIRPIFLLPLLKDGAMWAMKMAARKLILWTPPRSRWEPAKQDFMDFWFSETERLYEPFEHTIPVGRFAIRAVFFRHRGIESRIVPTIILCQSNCESFYERKMEWMIRLAVRKKKAVNFVVFDYPGVADSTGSMRSDKDLVDAATAVIERVKIEFGIQDHQIHIYGRSLGGCVAMLTKARRPALGQIVADRSPSSIDAVLKSRISSCAESILKTPLQGVHFRAAEAARQINQPGQVIVLYHPEDRVIPMDANLHTNPQVTAYALQRFDDEQIDIHNTPLIEGFEIAGAGQIEDVFFDQVFQAPLLQNLMILGF